MCLATNTPSAITVGSKRYVLNVWDLKGQTLDIVRFPFNRLFSQAALAGPQFLKRTFDTILQHCGITSVKKKDKKPSKKPMKSQFLFYDPKWFFFFFSCNAKYFQVAHIFKVFFSNVFFLQGFASVKNGTWGVGFGLPLSLSYQTQLPLSSVTV